MADDKSFVNDLIARLRQEIDEIDDEIISKVRSRSEIAARIARLKRHNSIPMVTGTRDIAVFTRYATALGQLGKTMAAALLLRNRDVPESDFRKPPGDSSSKTPG